MRRYYLEEENPLQIAYLSPSDSHHAVNVLRSKSGQEIEVVSQKGQLYAARIQELGPRVQVEILESKDNESELPVQVTIACGLSKGDKLETIVQKGTECGMQAMIPLALKRDVSQWKGKKAQQKQDRLQRIALEAAKQSKRLIIPQVHELMTLPDLIQESKNYDHLIVADEEQGHSNQHQNLAQVFNQIQEGDKLLAVFGSEGGLDREEVSLLKEAGFIDCSLGPRILRAETAPIYFLSALSYFTELA